LDHLLASFALNVELVTAPAKVLEEWAGNEFPLLQPGFTHKGMDSIGNLKSIPYKELDFSSPWDRFDIAHELTQNGIERFVSDYESTLQRTA